MWSRDDDAAAAQTWDREGHEPRRVRGEKGRGRSFAEHMALSFRTKILICTLDGELSGLDGGGDG